MLAVDATGQDGLQPFERADRRRGRKRRLSGATTEVETEAEIDERGRRRGCWIDSHAGAEALVAQPDERETEMTAAVDRDDTGASAEAGAESAGSGEGPGEAAVVYDSYDEDEDEDEADGRE